MLLVLRLCGAVRSVATLNKIQRQLRLTLAGEIVPYLEPARLPHQELRYWARIS